MSESKNIFSIHENFDFVTDAEKHNEHSFGVLIMLGLREAVGPEGGVAVIDISRLPEESEDETIVSKRSILDGLDDATRCAFLAGIESEDGDDIYVNAGSISGIARDSEGSITKVLVTLESEEESKFVVVDAFGTYEEMTAHTGAVEEFNA